MPYPKKIREIIKYPIRMTFSVEFDTARRIKERAKDERCYLPDYIARLVRIGLSHERKAAK